MYVPGARDTKMRRLGLACIVFIFKKTVQT